MKAYLFILVLVSSVVSLGASAQEKPMQPSKAVQALLSASDEGFVKNATSANQFEVQASRLAKSKSQDAQIQKFAEQMITDHTKAGEKLSSLAQQKGLTPPDKLAKHHQLMLDNLSGKSGKDFDDAYRRDMVLSHKEAVSLFDEAAKDVKDPDLKAFAAETLPKLQHHGAMAKDLKAGS